MVATILSQLLTGADAKADGKNPVQGGEEKGGKASMPKKTMLEMLTRLFKAGSKQRGKG